MTAIVFLPLSMGQVAIIDFIDFERVGRVKWSAKKSFGTYYAVRSVGPRRRQKRLWLHKEVLKSPRRIDHRNGDGRDNRRENLRPASSLLNSQAFRTKTPGKTSQFRGVTWYKRDHKWQASVEVRGTFYYVGRFETELEAAHARDEKARELGFPREGLNFP